MGVTKRQSSDKETAIKMSGYPGGYPTQGGGYPGSAPPASGGYPGQAPRPAGGYPGSAPPSGGYPGSAPPPSGYPGQAPRPAGGYPGSAPPQGGYPGYGAPQQPAVDPQVQQWFNAVDSDRSGQIEAKELQKALVNGNWSNFSEEACRMMIDMYDKDKKGTSTYTNLEHFSNTSISGKLPSNP